MTKKDNTLFCFRCYHTWKKRIKLRPSKYCPKCHSPYWNRPRTRVSKLIVEKISETIINVHNAIIKLSGGEIGVRDEGGIHNSTYKLLNNQNKNKKNPTVLGAFILNEFARRHYFIDGNKRTAYATAKIFMLVNGCHLKTEYSESASFIIKIAEYNSKITFEEIKKWLDENCKPVENKEIENYLNKVFVSLTLGKRK